MKKDKYRIMTAEMKREITIMFEKGHFDGIIKILEKYHPKNKEKSIDAMVYITSEFIEPTKPRKSMTPLAFLSTSTDVEGKNSGVAFGVTPEGIINYDKEDNEKRSDTPNKSL